MEGIINVLKPPAMSSSDAVVDIRKICETKRCGHLGTLDPEAAGVLPICVGRAVRLFDYLVDKKKEYIAEITFGTSTETQDALGTVIARSDSIVTMQDILSVLPGFQGNTEQVAPVYSALKYNGKKLYDLARKGAYIPEKKRLIEIDTLEVKEQIDTNRFLMRISCSRGTYIRTLCADIGEVLGVPAHMSFLLRSRSGMFTLDSSFSIAELKRMKETGMLEKAFVSCEQALMEMPALILEDDRKTPTLNGLDTHKENVKDGIYRLYAQDCFLGIGSAVDSDIRLKVNLYSENI